tara:strand:- start:1491 stop:1865 length:375 start_codon:yes stop_codon:yes gene_type:complete
MSSSTIIGKPNTICFKNNYDPTEWCKLNIIVTLKGGHYELTYTATYSSDDEFAKQTHPMYELSIQNDDEFLLEGVVVAANPITEHMIDCLLGEEEEMIKKYNLILRPYDAYCGELLRAMSELEI